MLLLGRLPIMYDYIAVFLVPFSHCHLLSCRCRFAFCRLPCFVGGSVDEHWIPVQDCCQPCAVTYDWILHFESLEEEAQMFLQLMNEEDRGHLRWSNHYINYIYLSEVG